MTTGTPINHTFLGKTVPLYLYVGQYANNGRTHVGAYGLVDGRLLEPWSDVTTNIADDPTIDGLFDGDPLYAYIEPTDLLATLVGSGVVTETRFQARSGFNHYRLCKLNPEAMLEHAVDRDKMLAAFAECGISVETPATSTDLSGQLTEASEALAADEGPMGMEETTEGFYYRIDGGTLYLSSDPDGKVPVSTHVDQYGDLHWSWTENHDITKVVIEDRIVPSTCDSMFYDCENLTSIEGLENLDISNVTNMSLMFSYCKSLTSLDLSNLDTSHVTDMSWMFIYCESIKSLDVSSFDTSSVTNMSYMFHNCKSLESLDLSGWDTPNVTNTAEMFYYCHSLKSLDLSSFDTSNVTRMAAMFAACKSLKTVTTSDKRIISEVPTRAKVVEPTARADREATPSLGDAIGQAASEALAADEGHTGRSDPDPR